MKHVRAVTLLPILTRELREAARKPGTFRMRMAVPTLAFLVVTAGLLLMPAADAVRGRAAYQLVGLVALLYAMLGGILLTADSIAGEREQGTLGLLFLTPLRARGILLGKLAATSLHGIYAMVGLLPLLSVPLMLGGIGLAEIVAHSLLLIATLAMSLAIGLHASTTSTSTGFAIARGLRTLALVVLLPIAIAFLSGFRYHWLTMASPPTAYFSIVRWAMTPGAPSLVLAPLVLIPCIAFWFFNRASNLLKPDDSPVANRGTGSGRTASATSSATVWGNRTPPPKGLLDANPILWLLWWQNRFPRADARFIAVTGSVAILGSIAALASELSWWTTLVAVFVLHFLASSHMLSQSCQRIRTQSERDALELYLTTPRGARGTLIAYHHAFCQLFQMQFWTLVILHLALLAGELVRSELSWTRSTLAIPLAGLGILIATRHGYSWVGLHMSIEHGGFYRAWLGTLLRIFLPAWGGLILLLLMGQGSSAHAWWIWLFSVGGLSIPLGSWHRDRAALWLREHGCRLPTNAA
jgi:hypothetical protein